MKLKTLFKGKRSFQDGVHRSAIFIAAVSFIGIALISIVIPIFILRIGDGGKTPVKIRFIGPPAIAGTVKLQPYPAADVAAFRIQKRTLLQSYGWVDRKKGVVHIPIDRAIELIAARSNSTSANESGL